MPPDYGSDILKNKNAEALDISARSVLKNCMSVAETMRRKLVAAFAPEEIAIEDQSTRHAGHAGARPEGETHFRLRIVASAFAGMNRLERQRRIYDVLHDELREHVHALSVAAYAPGEAGTQPMAESN